MRETFATKNFSIINSFFKLQNYDAMRKENA